jgi:AraC family transcriptional regulator
MSSLRQTSTVRPPFTGESIDAASHWSHFRLRSFPTLKTTPSSGVFLAAAYLKVNDSNFGPTEPPEPEPSFRVSVALQPMRLEAFWDQERWVSHLDHGRHSICLVDMERKPTVKFIDPFELVQFYVPQSALSLYAQEHSMRPVEGLRIPPPGFFDPAIASLASALVPAFIGTEVASGLFIDHVHLALQAHLLLKYAEMRTGCRPSRETLTPFQQRRAKEILEARISEDITLSELGREFNLSMAHFARAFRNSVGDAPHLWLTKRRIERAKHLLVHTDLLLPEIALECGFSHRISLSRAFSRIAGVTPSEWRREKRDLRWKGEVDDESGSGALTREDRIPV